jgi:hypothetical protein
MGIIGLGIVYVIGRTRVPLPAARIMAFIDVVLSNPALLSFSEWTVDQTVGFVPVFHKVEGILRVKQQNLQNFILSEDDGLFAANQVVLNSKLQLQNL